MDFDNYKDVEEFSMGLDRMVEAAFGEENKDDEENEEPDKIDLSYSQFCNKFSTFFNEQNNQGCREMIHMIMSALKHDKTTNALDFAEYGFIQQIFEILGWEINKDDSMLYELICDSVSVLELIIERAAGNMEFFSLLLANDAISPLISLLYQKDNFTSIKCLRIMYLIVRDNIKAMPYLFNCISPDYFANVLENEDNQLSEEVVKKVSILLFYMLKNGKVSTEIEPINEKEDKEKQTTEKGDDEYYSEYYSDYYSDDEEKPTEQNKPIEKVPENKSQTAKKNKEIDDKDIHEWINEYRDPDEINHQIIPTRKLKPELEDTELISAFFSLFIQFMMMKDVDDKGNPVDHYNDNRIVLGFQLLSALFHRPSANWYGLFSDSIELNTLIIQYVGCKSTYIREIVVQFLTIIYKQKEMVKGLPIQPLLENLAMSETNNKNDQEFSTTNFLALKTSFLIELMLKKSQDYFKTFSECDIYKYLQIGIDNAPFSTQQRLLNLLVFYIENSNSVYAKKSFDLKMYEYLFTALQYKDLNLKKHALIALKRLILLFNYDSHNLLIENFNEDHESIINELIDMDNDNDDPEVDAIKQMAQDLHVLVDNGGLEAPLDDDDSDDNSPMFNF